MAVGKKIVLVVDDEVALRDFVRRNLEIRGFQVLTAANGLEALALFSAHGRPGHPGPDDAPHERPGDDPTHPPGVIGSRHRSLGPGGGIGQG